MREEILRSAAELIAELGWGHVTTRKVAERAGVNNALIHYYFGSKDELLRRAITEGVAAAFEEPLAALAEADDIHGGIDAFFDAIERTGSDSRMLIGAEVLLQGMRDPVIRRWAVGLIEDAADDLASLIAEGQASGALRPDVDPAGLSLALMAALDSLTLYRLVHPELEMDAVRAALHTMLGTREGPA